MGNKSSVEKNKEEEDGKIKEASILDCWGCKCVSEANHFKYLCEQSEMFFNEGKVQKAKKLFKEIVTIIVKEKGPDEPKLNHVLQHGSHNLSVPIQQPLRCVARSPHHRLTFCSHC